VVQDFITHMARWGKGGNYGTCLLPMAGDASQCQTSVIVRGSAGLVALPVRSGPYIGHRSYAYGSMISDIPVADTHGGADVERYDDAYRTVRLELFRAAIRSALLTW
jgi:hypothetical protein